MNKPGLVISLLLLVSACGGSDNNPLPGNGVPSPGVKASFGIHTISIGEYTADLYVPSAPHPNNAYPVIYFNDGDTFRNTFSTLTSVRFEGENSMEPFIMVGIYAGGAKRTGRYTPYHDEWIKQNRGNYTPGASAYTYDLVETVIPAIEEQLPAIDTGRRAIMGISLGGLHAAWAAINHPDKFSFAGSLSPSFWVAGYAIFNEPNNSLENVTFYFDQGTGEWNNYVPFIGSLQDVGLIYGHDIFYYEVPGGKHVETDWSQRIAVPVKLFLYGRPGGPPSYQIEVECIRSQNANIGFYQRINPIVSFPNGVKYSLSTSAGFSIIEGDGELLQDGRFDVAGASMTIEVRHSEWVQQLEISDCN